LREFLNRLRMNMGVTPPLDGVADPDERKKHEKACPHQKLYGGGDRTRIDFAAFLEDMARQANVPPGIIRIKFRNVHLSSDTAVHCGFILKELLANFTRIRPGEKGRVIIDLCPEGDYFNLVVSDYGSHFCRDIDLHGSESLSARLIMLLAQQINGKVEFDRHSCEFRLRFSEPGILESLQL